MKVAINLWADKFNASSTREKILIILATLAVLYVLWQSIVYKFILSPEDELVKRLETAKQQILTLKAHRAALSELIANDPTQSLKNQLQNLIQENFVIETMLKTKTNKMIGPKEMITIIKQLVEQTKGLNIIKMESSSPLPLFKAKENEPLDKKAVQVYLHALNIELNGGFQETYEFLKRVEDSKMNIFWDELSYEVETYPRAMIKIIIHTLSLQEGFIGV